MINIPWGIGKSKVICSLLPVTLKCIEMRDDGEDFFQLQIFSEFIHSIKNAHSE